MPHRHCEKTGGIGEFSIFRKLRKATQDRQKLPNRYKGRIFNDL